MVEYNYSGPDTPWDRWFGGKPYQLGFGDFDEIDEIPIEKVAG